MEGGKRRWQKQRLSMKARISTSQTIPPQRMRESLRVSSSADFVLFFDMENTSKIVASAWKESDYLGFKDAEIGKTFALKFVRSSKSDRVYLREAKQM